MRNWIARTYMRLFGWRLVGQAPPIRKYVILAAPHTSNWDLPIMLAAARCLGVKLSWMGKHTIFRWPIARLMKSLGGISIDRRSRHDTVAQAVDAFNKAEDLVLLIPPEGTRKRAEYWKSGFYHIAHRAKVPIILGILNYKTRDAGFGPIFQTAGDIKADMDAIRDFYKDAVARHPPSFGPIRLRQEDQPVLEETKTS